MFVGPEKYMAICLLYLLFPEIIFGLFIFWGAQLLFEGVYSIAAMYTAHEN